jgi:hypothetical protein
MCNIISNCCCARPLGEIEHGMCSECKEHCEFEKEEEFEFDISHDLV